MLCNAINILKINSSFFLLSLYDYIEWKLQVIDNYNKGMLGHHTFLQRCGTEPQACSLERKHLC